MWHLTLACLGMGVGFPKVYKTIIIPFHYVHQEIMADKIDLELVFKFNCKGNMNSSCGYLVQMYN